MVITPICGALLCTRHYAKHFTFVTLVLPSGYGQDSTSGGLTFTQRLWQTHKNLALSLLRFQVAPGRVPVTLKTLKQTFLLIILIFNILQIFSPISDIYVSTLMFLIAQKSILCV